MGTTPSAEVEQAGEPASLGHELSSAAQAAAAILGLAGYVYLIGGIVSWVRFGAARLPSDAAVGALENRTLFEVGLRAIVFSGLAFTVVCALAYVAAGNWEANGPEWHELIRRRGVRPAAAQLTDRDAKKARQARRTRALSVHRANRWEAVSRAAGAAGLGMVAGKAGAREEHHASLAQAQPPADPPSIRSPSLLGDRAVRVIAGFNNLLLSAVVGLALARLVELLFPHAWWAILVVWLLASSVAAWLLARWGPLRWGPLGHGLAWLLVAAAALFVAAPVGLLLVAGSAVSTAGRVLARMRRPMSLAELLRSPLPWALFTFYALAGLAYYAAPPVSFQRAFVVTGSGDRVGGFLSRTGGDVYLVTCTPLADATSVNERVARIAGRDVRALTLGGPDAVVDSGERPSIAALATRALGIDAHPPTLFRVDLRARRATCAGAPPPSLSAGAEDPALGPGAISGPARPDGKAHDGEVPIGQTTPARIAALARLYQPTVEVTVADRFWPVSVGAVLKDIGSGGGRTCLVSGSSPACGPVASPASLVAAGSQGSDYLRYPAMLRSDPTNQFQAFERGQRITTGPAHSWLADPGVLDPWYTAQVYFYYRGPIATSQWPSRARDPGVKSGLIGLEYWFFYPFNYYPTVLSPGLMQNAPLAGDSFNTDLHQGDWEHVVVLIDPATSKPQWLYTARHADEGQFFPWDSPTLAFDQGHPIVQGAFGGHPSYDNRCAGRPRSRLHNVSSDWVACGSGRFAFRASTTPLVDLAQTSWACWRGHFGEAKPGLESDRLGESDNVLSRAREFEFVAGPASPLRQAENTGVCDGAGPKAPELLAARQPAGHQPTARARRRR